ncbi:hypothetical protein, partial [Acinetobacter baumannii]|uniref:hypothetical protein n=1 Tax=Acinetobacter baumannii TaxID=470 RepID=UPI001BC8827D
YKENCALLSASRGQNARFGAPSLGRLFLFAQCGASFYLQSCKFCAVGVRLEKILERSWAP